MYLCASLRKLLILLLTLCFVSIANFNLLATDSVTQQQKNQESDTNSEPDYDIYEDDNIVTPVEIGPAGDIKRESPYRTQAEEAFPIHFHAMWESRYITEGRDNLSGDSLFSLSTDISYGNFTFAPWIADSPDTDYRELNLNLVYGFEIGKHVELYASYTYLDSNNNGEKSSDNEVGIELVYTGFKHLSVKANWNHSFDADGSYYELALRHQTNLVNDLTVSAALNTGFNDGYVTDGHSGIDKAQLRVGLAYHPWQKMELIVYLSHSQAIDRDASRYPGDASLSDYTWGGLGATYRF